MHNINNMSIDCGVKPYIKNLTNNEQLQEALNNKHNAIFKRLYDSKTFKLFKGILYETPATANAGKEIIRQINSEYGVLVTKTQNPVSGKPYVFVNVRNLLQSTWDEINPNKPKDVPKQGNLFGDRYSTNNKDSESLKEGLQWLKQVMPNVQPNIVDGLIDEIANGKYDIGNDLITLSKEFATKGVVKEEVFHKIFALLPKVEQEKLLNEGSKKYGIERGESKATVKYSLAQQNQINYTLKSANILQSKEGQDIWNKGIKNNWSLDMIFTEMKIPKEQKDLIKNIYNDKINNIFETLEKNCE